MLYIFLVSRNVRCCVAGSSASRMNSWQVEDIADNLAADLDGSLSGLGVDLSTTPYSMRWVRKISTRTSGGSRKLFNVWEAHVFNDRKWNLLGKIQSVWNIVTYKPKIRGRVRPVRPLPGSASGTNPHSWEPRMIKARTKTIFLLKNLCSAVSYVAGYPAAKVLNPSRYFVNNLSSGIIWKFV